MTAPQGPEPVRSIAPRVVRVNGNAVDGEPNVEVAPEAAGMPDKPEERARKLYAPSGDLRALVESLIAREPVQLAQYADDTRIDRIVRAQRASPIEYSRSDIDLNLWFSEAFWSKWDERRREAATYHALLHVQMSDRGVLLVRMAHDVEEFSSVGYRYGGWWDPTDLFARQLQLFEAENAAAAANGRRGR